VKYAVRMGGGWNRLRTMFNGRLWFLMVLKLQVPLPESYSDLRERD
jgi:hypothetical protein